MIGLHNLIKLEHDAKKFGFDWSDQFMILDQVIDECREIDEVIDKEFETLTIPVFTHQPGPMPTVYIDMWQNIWRMNTSDLGGARAYIADFEVYDELSRDHNNVTLDIYIVIKK